MVTFYNPLISGLVHTQKKFLCTTRNMCNNIHEQQKIWNEMSIVMEMSKTKMWLYIQPVAYYIAVIDEWTTAILVWINLRIIILSEKSKSPKTMYNMIISCIKFKNNSF